MIENHGTFFDSGQVIFKNAIYAAKDLKWNPHASFPGVLIKHLIRGDATGGRLSCHIVRVEPGYSLQEHIHEGKLELHEVVSGNGSAKASIIRRGGASNRKRYFS